jgi:hypothetical protein
LPPECSASAARSTKVCELDKLTGGQSRCSGAQQPQEPATASSQAKTKLAAIGLMVPSSAVQRADAKTYGAPALLAAEVYPPLRVQAAMPRVNPVG